jgi:DNA-3-methyladenine glycosylase
MERLPRAFYDRDTVEVARDLLGKIVCARPGRTLRMARIVETEAYHGTSDQASHGRRLTPRSAVMYGPPGHAYIYVIYGIWSCLNVVTGPETFPSAVLLRAAALSGHEPRIAAGPGKLCRALHLDRRLNGVDLVEGHKLWLGEDGFMPEKVHRGPRIGVEYAGAWARRPWRFWIADHPSVSRLT